MLFAALASCLSVMATEYSFAKSKSGDYGAWSASIAKSPVPVKLVQGAGVDGSDALVIENVGTQSFKIAIDNAYFVPGKKYRFGGWIKTENLKTRRSRFVIHNNHWRRDISGRNFPANTKGKWVKFEYSGVMMESSNGLYTFCAHIDKPVSGKLELSKLYVAPYLPEDQIIPASYSFTAKTDPDAASHDPDFIKLTDGNTINEKTPYKARSGQTVLWRHKHNMGKGPVITFNFATPVSLDTIKVHYYRWKNSYGIKEIRVTGINGDQRVVAGNIVLNHPYTKPDADPAFDVAEIESATDQKFTSVEVSFIPTGGWLSLNEIEFFGKADKAEAAPAPVRKEEAKKKTEPAAQHPLAAELTSAAPAGLRLMKKDGMIVMENDHVIYVLQPADSGSVNFAYDRASKSNLAIYNRPGTGFGSMFCDRVYPGGYDIRDMYRNLEYQVEIVADTPQKKQVRLSGNGRTGIFRNVVMSKLFTLTPESPVLHVEHTISNGMDNVIPLRYGYWMCGGAQSPNGYSRIVPGGNGVEVYPGLKQLTVRDLSSGWMAAKDNKSDNMLVLMMPYDLLSEYYFWPGNDFIGTMEFKLGVYPIKAGESLKFDMALCPLSGLGIPAKVTTTAALSFGELPQSPVLKARIFDKKACTLKISGGFLTNGKVDFKELLTREIPAGSKIFTAPYTLPAGKGTLVLKAELIRNNTVVMSAETSTVIGTASGVWRVTPDCERKPDINAGQAKANLNFKSMEFETPHIKWGKPFAGRRPKVLAINFGYGGIREMVEVAQRFDIDLTTNYTAGLWALSGYVMSLSVKDCVAQLNDKLKTKYDVILISGAYWQYLTPALTGAIMNQVSDGTGLIVINPANMPDILKKYFTAGPADRRGTVQWAAVAGKNLFTGIPFEVMPKVRNHNYNITGGEVLATAGEKPLIVKFDHGKGKIFLAAYQGKVPRQSRRSTFFLPSVIDDNPCLDWHYYEYHHMMLAKMIYAAAGENCGLEVNAISADKTAVKLDINAAQNIKANIEVTLRDKFSRTVGTVSKKIDLVPGQNKLELPLPQATLHGIHFADTIISTGKGKAWWGTAQFQNTAPAYFTGTTLASRVYKPQENLTPAITVSGEGKVISRLYDTSGNLFAYAEGTDVSLPLADCLSATATLEIQLLKDGKEVDRAVKGFDIWRKPDGNFFQIAQGWPGVVEKAPLYLTDVYTKLLKDHYFVTSTGGSSVSWDNREVTRSFRKNGILFLSHEFGAGTGGKYPFDRNLKPKSKFELIRVPCLSDPAVLENIRTSPSRPAKSYAIEYGGLIGAGADEANMFGDWDGCYCQHCMKDLRIFLKESYGSLDALNASWQTKFANWDEVIPMTLPEARKHTSLAPWVDHRTFNDFQRGRALGIQNEAAFKYRGVNVSLSGTSDTNPWNAWDYYRIMPHMKAIAGYFGEQTIQHRSFAKGKLFSMPWIGYDVPYDEHNFQVIRALMNGVSGLNFFGTFYITPDWNLPVAGKELKAVLNRYLGGRADAIMHFDALVYPIAMHYSPASIKVDYVFGKNDMRKSSTSGFRNILGDNALNYNYLAYGQIEKGEFGNFRIIMLPLSMALSDKECRKLAEFVKNGGIVIADMGAGHYDDHGVRKINRKELLDLFGVSTFGEIRKVKAKVSGVNGNFDKLNISVNNVETGIKASTAKVLGKVTGDFGTADAIFVNSYGKGKAIYLATGITETIGDQGALRYTRKNAANTAMINEFFRELATSVNIKPLVQAPTLRSTELLLRENNGAYIIGFVRDIDQTRNTETKASTHKITFDRKFHVWDLLEKRYMGFGSEFEYKFGPVTQSVWVVMSYKPTALTADVVRNGRDCKISLVLQADTKNFTRHIINFTLKDKNGKVNEAYTRKLIMDGGKCTFEIKLPLNYPADNWVMEAQEVFSSCKVEKAL